MSDAPVVLSHPELVLPKLHGTSPLNLGGIWGMVRSGQTVLASDGKRFIWHADSLSVIYSQNGKFYSQTSRGFIGEVRTAPFVLAGRSALPMARVAEAEMKLLLGILAGSGTAGFVLVIGSEVGEFVIENRENFETWRQQLEVVLRVRSQLKAIAPTIYDKLFSAVLHRLYADTKARIPHAVTAETVAFGVGVIIGSVGKKMAKGKFGVLALVFIVLEQFAVRGFFTLVGAVKITADDYKRLAADIIRKLREAGVAIQELDAREIIEEVQRHPAEVKKALEELRRVFGS